MCAIVIPAQAGIQRLEKTAIELVYFKSNKELFTGSNQPMCDFNLQFSISTI